MAHAPDDFPIEELKRRLPLDWKCGYDARGKRTRAWSTVLKITPFGKAWWQNGGKKGAARELLRDVWCFHFSKTGEEMPDGTLLERSRGTMRICVRARRHVTNIISG